MLVRCDVCGVEPAAVLCCADEAALCSACDRRVHRANKLADKHRRIPLLHPSGDHSSAAADAAAPLCDVCKERRGLVFCVEDRAILCADCDDPIHSANDLTAKHSRFLLVGAKLSAALVDNAPPDSPDEPHDVAAAAISPPAAHQQDSSCAAAKSPVPDCSNNSYGAGCGAGGGGNSNSSSSISDYLTNICPGWRVDDLLFDDAAFSAASKAGGCDEYEHEQVPCLDADLFDVIAAGRPATRGAWYGSGMGGLEKAPPAAASSIAVPTAAKQQQQQQGRVRERYWNSDSDSDVFAVPEISQQPPPSSFWCF